MQETFNPILSQEDVRGWSLTKEIPVPSPSTVLVLSRSGDELEVISHTDKPISFSRFKFGRYNFLYKIDMAEYVLIIACSLPSKTPGFEFPTTVEITCSVFDPKIIVRAGTQDVASVLKARLIDEMKQISRDYNLRDNAIAEKDINRSVRRRVIDERRFDDLGLRIPQLVASLQIDSSVIDDIRQETRTELQAAVAMANIEAELKLKQAEELAQFKLDELKRMRSLAQQKHYENLLEGGERSILAAYLAQNPENISEIISRFDQLKQLASGGNMELLKIMIQEDALEGSQLGDAGMRVLRRLMGLTESPQAALEGDSKNQGSPSLSNDDNDDEDDLNDVPD